jgi:signal transduction histidine kinase
MDGHSALRVTADHSARDEGERLAAAARTAAQAERHRLARDLHDSVTQTLVSLHLSAQAAAELWDAHPDRARAALDLVRHLASGAATEMRALLVELREAVLERDGLGAALEAYGAVVRQLGGLHVELDLAGAARAGPPGARGGLPPAHEAALYYLSREALANVVKHARASRAAVHVSWVRESTVRLVVEDDGIGFGAPAGAFSYGLAGMRERVEALGGALQLENGPGGGARVVAELPVPQEPSGR